MNNELKGIIIIAIAFLSFIGLCMIGGYLEEKHEETMAKIKQTCEPIK
jgi:hypothetical protein